MTSFTNVLQFLSELVFLGVQILVSFAELFYRCIFPKEEKNIAGEVAVVTGGGHGIGLELVRQLSDLGVKVAVWDINKTSADEAIKEVEEKGGTGLALTVDVADRESVHQAVARTRHQLGEVTLLFNNAGIMPCKLFLNHSEDDIEKLFSVNVFSQFWTVMEFLPRMLSLKKGHIVSISSIAGVTGTPNLVPYCSSKFAVKGLMDALQIELRQTYPDSGIKTTVVHPVTVNTGLALYPKTRFPSLMPILSPEYVASQTISAMRRDEEYAFVPSHALPLTVLVKLLPRKAQHLTQEYFDYRVEAH